MPINLLVENDQIVRSLRHAVTHADRNLDSVPGLLTMVIDDDCWRERVEAQTGEIVRFERFADFVTQPPLEGMGASLDMLTRMCRDDPAALAALDRVAQLPRGRPRATDNVTIRHDIAGRPSTESRQRALRTLREKRPDLHQQVLDKALTASSAMKIAGLRRPRVSIYVDNVDAAAHVLCRHFTPADIARLIDALQHPPEAPHDRP